MDIRRRAVLSTLAGLGLGTLSGCLGSPPAGDNGRPLPRARSAVESWTGGERRVPAPATELAAVTDGLVGTTDHFVRYSLRSATVQTYAALQGYDYPNGAQVWVVLSTYPGPERDAVTLAEGRTAVDDVTERDQQVTVALDVETVPEEPLFLQAYVVRADRTLQTVGPGEGEKLCETDPFVVADGELVRYDHEHGHAPFAQDGYLRKSAEGVYLLSFTGWTDREDWRVSFVAYKSAYVREKYAARKRRSQYVTDAMADGTADSFGAILAAEAEANGFRTHRAQVDFLIDFVQNLPYVPDDVGTGYDDYTKHMVETLVEGGGDCEDTAVMLASLLQSDSFNYDTVLLLLPGHMAVGVYGDDLPGTYYEYDGRRYYYVETTGRGWDVGEVPEEYATESAYVSQV